MQANEIREAFLQFFEDRDHKIVPSAPIVVKDDPSLMFTNAGMNQFKPYFLGQKTPDSGRVADSQKCLRVSGKHNDLEEVGVDTYHHTMFEMLGNWSFGDYFKEGAIAWAWQLLTEVYGIDKDRIYVTVFGGDEADGLPADIEAESCWQKHMEGGRVLRFGRRDNFWEMGDTGPCGPSSEIHVDVRPDDERSAKDGRSLVNTGHPQVVEIWNLVFIQFDRKSSGKLEKLPQQHVDTGMGFERLCMVLQDAESTYDTDVFEPLIGMVESLSGHQYKGSTSKEDIAIRVIVDHIRAITFCIADGQLPSNTGAGYVVRRILRRAVRYGFSFLDLKESFMSGLIPVLQKQMGHQFPELEKQSDLIGKVIEEEEESFRRTLEKGISRFNEYRKNHEEVEGSFAFELYDTYGFPIDLTRLMADEEGMKVDMDGFNEALAAQKKRSRSASETSAGDWTIVQDGETEFVGYDNLEAEVRILRYRKVSQKKKEFYQVVLDKTPFYPEGGGQVGDTGYLKAGEEKFSVKDTRKEHDTIVHILEKLPNDLDAPLLAVVSGEKREAAALNHTATHLLHKALREVLGDHVEQRGSLVTPDYLRFDFSHFEKLSALQIAEVESKVNRWIREDLERDEHRGIPMQEAKHMGAIALFGEKYGDEVRVIRFGDSIELCGGTHASSTGKIGLFKIVAESSVASGIRRIEAITAGKAEDFVNDRLKELEEIKGMLKAGGNISGAVKQLLDKNIRLESELEDLAKKEEGRVKDSLKEQIEQGNGVNYLVKEVDLDAGAMKNLSFQLRNEVDNLVMVLGSAQKKPAITVMIADSLLGNLDFNAVDLVRELATEINGGGGGQPFFATAGGKSPEGIPAALEKARLKLSHLS